MNKKTDIVGGCLCGVVKFRVTGSFSDFTYCYCERCRKATGAGRAAVLIARANQLCWTSGGENLRRWDLPAAVSFATAFCTCCGSPLPRLTRDKKFAVIPAGSLDQVPLITPQCHEHWASRASWVCLNESGLPVYTGDSP